MSVEEIDGRWMGQWLCRLGSVLMVGLASWGLAEDVGQGGEGAPALQTQQMVEQASSLRPSPRQINWHEREVEVLIHFGVNTFTGREWGTGGESAALFDPSDVDARQWVAAAKLFGAKGIVLVTKHHDGFCLWPSKFTEHSVKNSPWRGGQGDLVAEVSNACAEAGIAFGIYLSPSDLNHPLFGRRSEAYNDYFCNQLEELLTNYGPISQVFFDGANPPGRQQRYDFQRYYRVIRELQPDAVISIRGPDVRWIGNESGDGRDIEWSVVPLPAAKDGYDWPNMIQKDIGSREKLAKAVDLHWYPAVATVPMHRNRWFWSPDNKKSQLDVDDLFRSYVRTVGKNAGLLLNLCPDNTGRIPEYDLRQLEEFGDRLKAAFGTDLTKEGAATAGESVDLESGARVYWVDLAGRRSVKWLVLEEPVEQGQQVESFEVWGRGGEGWKQSHQGSTIGKKRILGIERLGDVDRIEVRILESRGRVSLNVSAY